MPMPSSGALGGAHDTTWRISVATDAPTCQASVSWGMAAWARSQHPAAQPDPGDHRAVDAEVDGDDVRPLLGHPDARRRPARAPPSGRRPAPAR